MLWELLRPAPLDWDGRFSETPGRKSNWRESPRYVAAKKMGKTPRGIRGLNNIHVNTRVYWQKY